MPKATSVVANRFVLELHQRLCLSVTGNICRLLVTSVYPSKKRTSVGQLEENRYTRVR